MHLTLFATFFQTSPAVLAMCAADIALFLLGAWAAKGDIAEAHGTDKVVALANLCFAMPLAVFGALHLFGAAFVLNLVPRYMPARTFWVYFIGVALLAAAISIASKIAVRWSGLLFGIMMFLFVAMIHLPGAVALRNNRIIWTIVFREMSFGGGGWVLAGNAASGWPGRVKTVLVTVGRILIAVAAIVFGLEHFLHPMGLPGVPLVKEMPAWIPGRALIDYATGAALLAAGGSILLNKKTRGVAASVGGWLLVLVVVIYGPVLLAALSAPGIGAKVEGINYFNDTLLFTGAILAVAKSTPRSS